MRRDIKTGFTVYRPLMVITLIALLGAVAIQVRLPYADGESQISSLSSWAEVTDRPVSGPGPFWKDSAQLFLPSIMHRFMGLFLLIFALFKLIDLPGFVRGFRKYDLLTQKITAYGYTYPLIELILALLYLNEYFLTFAYIGTLLVSLVTAVGVVHALRQNMSLQCACLGTVLNLPLSSVSLFENIGMSAMAMIMLVLTA